MKEPRKKIEMLETKQTDQNRQALVGISESRQQTNDMPTQDIYEDIHQSKTVPVHEGLLWRRYETQKIQDSHRRILVP